MNGRIIAYHTKIMLAKNLEEALEITSKLPAVVEREAERILFVGDLHGYTDALEYVERELEDEKMLVVFLGDYVDRGPKQIEVLEKVTDLLITYPERVITLRGNHEDEHVNRMYDFYYVISREFSQSFYQKVKEFFASLPIAFRSRGIAALHGGLPVKKPTVERLFEEIEKRESTLDDDIREILRNDPNDMLEEYSRSIRGEGIYEFGQKIVEAFFSSYKDIKFLIRAHQIFSRGYRRHFNGRILTITSIPPVMRIAEVYYHNGIPMLRVAMPKKYRFLCQFL